MSFRSPLFNSFIVQPTRSSRARIRRIKIHDNWIKLSALVLAVVCAVALYGLYALTQQTAQARLAIENERLRLENAQHRQQLNTLEERVEAVEETSERIVKLSGVEATTGETTMPAPQNASPQHANQVLINQDSGNHNFDDRHFQDSNKRRGAGGPWLPVDSDVTINVVHSRTLHLARALQSYEAMMRQRARTPSIMPVADGEFTDNFGGRRDPFGTDAAEFHAGQDIAAPTGTPVFATGSGTVVFAGTQNGYGNLITIEHGNGLQTRYAHLSHIDVQAGQSVTRGDLIGAVGSTGRSTGAHLHYEVRVDERPVNPRRYFPRR